LGQEPQPTVAASSVPPDVRQIVLEMDSTVDVPSISNPFLAAPIMCGADGEIFFRTASSTAVADLIAVSRDGKKIISFSRNKINDILNPSPITFFTRGSEIYILVRGSTREGKTLTLRRPDGSTENQEVSSSREFIARFKADGTYLGAVALEMPFRPFQIGVFPSGDFLIAGATKDMQDTRVALVKSNGQFQRFVELKDDIRLRSQSDDETNASSSALPRTGKHFGDGFLEAAQISSIVSDGPNLLLVRTGQRVPVFSISPGGEAKAIRLDTPDGYNLWDLRTTRDLWIALYTHRLAEGAGVEFSSMAIDPKTGKALEVYSYPKFPGFGLACSDGIQFSFLVRDGDTLRIVKLISSHRASEKKP